MLVSKMRMTIVDNGLADQSNHQSAIRSILKAHLKLERLAGGEIHPAARSGTLSAGGREDDDRE